MRHGPLLRRGSLPALLALTLVAGAGCRTWRHGEVSVSMARAITDAGGRPIRLHTRSNDRVAVRDAGIVGDSVIGRLHTHRKPQAGTRVAVALADVLAVEQSRVSAGRTALAAAGGLVVVLGILVLFISSTDDDEWFM